MKILLLEDDFSLNKIIKSSLENKGFFVQNFTNGIEAITQVLNTKFDIYILDINVPGFDGHKVLQHIREQNIDMPVIIITAASDINSMQKAYELGCNEYMKKPFDFEELFVRINYLIKTKLNQDISHNIDLGYGYSFCIKEQKLYKQEHEIDLTHKEVLLFSLLVQNINKVVPFELIHEYVWESKEVESVSMRSVVHKLQKKLKSGMILNIRGVGYKLFIQDE